MLKLRSVFKNHLRDNYYSTTQLWWGNFTKGKAESARCFTLVAFLCHRPESGGWGGGEAYERQQPLAALRPYASDAPLPWTGRNDRGATARWPLLSHLTERHWLWLREGHLLQPLGERLGYHDCKGEKRGVLTLEINSGHRPASSWGGESETAASRGFFPGSPVQAKSKEDHGSGYLLFMPAQHPSSFSSDNTSRSFLEGPCPIPHSLTGEPGSWEASPNSRGWSHEPSLTNQCRLLCWPPWLADGWAGSKSEWYSTPSIL